jgi:hypothetical protein
MSQSKRYQHQPKHPITAIQLKARELRGAILAGRVACTVCGRAARHDHGTGALCGIHGAPMTVGPEACTHECRRLAQTGQELKALKSTLDALHRIAPKKERAA